jgi:hypothetical protein
MVTILEKPKVGKIERAHSGLILGSSLFPLPKFFLVAFNTRHVSRIDWSDGLTDEHAQVAFDVLRTSTLTGQISFMTTRSGTVALTMVLSLVRSAVTSG